MNTIRIVYELENTDNVTAAEVARLDEIGKPKIIGKRVYPDMFEPVTGVVLSVTVEAAPKKKARRK